VKTPTTALTYILLRQEHPVYRNSFKRQTAPQELPVKLNSGSYTADFLANNFIT
jgi:hypothetical protein